MWIAEILGSDAQRRALRNGQQSVADGESFLPEFPEHSHRVNPLGYPPSYSSCRCARSSIPQNPRHPLHILSTNPKGAHTRVIALTSILLPTHHLQTRSLALDVFCRIVSGRFFPQVEKFLDEDLGEYLRAVGVPFLFDLQIPFQPTFTVHYGGSHTDRVCIVRPVTEPPPAAELRFPRRVPVHERREEDGC